MSAVAERPVPGRAAARKVDGNEREYRVALRAFAQLTAAAQDITDADDLLRLVAATACDATGIRRCAAYMREDARGVFVGRAGHPGEAMDAGVRRLTMGGPTDAITAEIVRNRAPCLIRDARSDPRAARTAVREWSVRSLLGVPMLHGGEVVGLLILDNADEPHPYGQAHIEIATALADLGAAALMRVQAAAQHRAQLETATRQNRLLRGAATADHRLGQVLLGGGGLRSFARVIAELTGKPAALYDSRLRRVAAASAPGDDGDFCVRLVEDAEHEADVAGLLGAAAGGASTAVGPLLQAGIRHRHLVAPVDVGDDRWGWVVVKEHPSRLTAFDELTLRRAAKHIALEVAAQRRASAAAWDGRSLLARQLIRGTPDADVRRGADHLGIALEAPRVVAFFTRAAHLGGDIDAEALVAAVSARVAGEVLATKGPEGVALLMEVHGGEPALAAIRRVKACLEQARSALAGADGLIAGISTICRDPAAVPRGYREAREVARCIDSLAGTAAHRVLAADDLGPGRLFVANGDSVAIERFVEDVIGPLLTGEDGSAGLLRTLQSFYGTGRSVRLSSARLGVHENTVRYRLARVHAVTGLDVASDADDQLSVQMALLVLRLQGHPALPAFDGEEQPVVAEGVA